ncbi:polycomb group RING finger protein 1-like [Tubulanus polymorphus]|uniref:polycomb group RING finger protein 1-like n=1 Tax=Tubulanus polymorphus TaxID=672921 RepID=UPI003DA3AA46
MMDEGKTLKIRIRDINPHIVCSLCAGYFIDATTIAECLHTFCKSCIVKYLQTSKYCPQCNLKIHETQPFLHLRSDRNLQDIVYKLVPGLYENEQCRKQEFFKSKISKGETENMVQPLCTVYDARDAHHYIHDELITMCLDRFSATSVVYESSTYNLPVLDQKFIRCPTRTCVAHLKKLLRKMLDIPQPLEIDVVCDEQVLDCDYSVKQIWLMFWSDRPSPMMLFYKVHPKVYLHLPAVNS